MKSITTIILSIAVSLISTSCYKKGGPWGIKGKGEVIEETRSISPFDRIDLSVDADIYYTQDSVYSLEVSGQANILKILTTEVNGHELKVDFKRNVWDHKTVKIIVHSPAIRAFKIDGSGDVRIENNITCNYLDLEISGSGNISLLGLTAKGITAKITGSGDLQVGVGKVDTEDFTISGSGAIKAGELVCSYNTTEISGSGDVTVNVKETLDVKISGSGDLRYKGRPAIRSDIDGSGRLIPLD